MIRPQPDYILDRIGYSESCSTMETNFKGTISSRSTGHGIRVLVLDWLIDFILPYTDVCIALHTLCFPSVCEKTSQATRAGFEPTTSCLLSADIWTSRPPSLPGDEYWYHRTIATANEPVISSHCVNLKLGHRFHALLKVCADRDNTPPLKMYQQCFWFSAVFCGILFIFLQKEK